MILTVTAVISLIFIGFSSLSASGKLDLTDIRAVLEFKETYKDMKMQDPSLPVPHVLLQGLSKIPSSYLHEENWVFEADSLENNSDFSHILTYSRYLKGFSVIFSVDYKFFDISSLKSRAFSKVHIHQRDDIVFSRHSESYSQCLGPRHP